VVLYLFDSLKFKVQSSEYIIEIEKIKNQFPLKPFGCCQQNWFYRTWNFNYSPRTETLNIKLIFWVLNKVSVSMNLKPTPICEHRSTT
jgi:tRNA modification GTPase